MVPLDEKNLQVQMLTLALGRTALPDAGYKKLGVEQRGINLHNHAGREAGQLWVLRDKNHMLLGELRGQVTTAQASRRSGWCTRRAG